MFPDARFVHIVRDPYVVFSSTVNLWKSLVKTHGLQTPTYHGVQEQAFWREQAGYQTNKYKPLDQGLRDEITRRWGVVIEGYGYGRISA